MNDATGRPIALALGALLALSAATSHAQDEDAQTPPYEEPVPEETARPFYVSLGLGPVVRLDGGAALARIEEQAGLHFDGVPRNGFIGVVLSEDVGDAFRLRIGVRADWDLELLHTPDVAIQLSPSLALCFALDVIGGATFGYFDPELTFAIRVLLLQGFLGVWLRPAVIDVMIGEVVYASYAALLGADVHF